MADLFNPIMTGIGGAAQLISIFFKDKTTIGNIDIECTLEEKYVDTMEITTHPVEQGTAISDHAYMQPLQVTIHGGFSVSMTLNGIAAEIGDLLNDTGTKLQNTYTELVALQTAREPFAIVTGLRTYDNMLIKELSVTRNKDTQHILDFTATCQEVQIATIGTASIPAAVQTLSKKTLKSNEQGVKQVTQKPVPESALHRGFGA